MTTKQIISIACVALFTFAPAGCAMHTTVVKDKSQQSIQFASLEASQTFYDAYHSDVAARGNDSVVFYLPFPYWHRTVKADNIHLHSIVDSTDANHDGLISDDEARAYASTVHPPVY